MKERGEEVREKRGEEGMDSRTEVRNISYYNVITSAWGIAKSQLGDKF